MSQQAKPSSTATEPKTAKEAPKRATENKNPKQHDDNVQRTNQKMAHEGDLQGPTDAQPYDGKTARTKDDRARR